MTYVKLAIVLFFSVSFVATPESTDILIMVSRPAASTQPFRSRTGGISDPACMSSATDVKCRFELSHYLLPIKTWESDGRVKNLLD